MKPAVRDAGLLAILCCLLYVPGLASHGVTNWQEAQRLVVAREMQASGDWIVPTINGSPYLAKPPLIYWSQLLIAKLTGTAVDLWHLRLTVALFGVLGVVATYLVTLRLLGKDADVDQIAGIGKRGVGFGGGRDGGFARSAALASGLTLATGVLYFRSARIGEIDILVAPFIVVAVGAIACASLRVRGAFERGEALRQPILPVLVATAATVGAALAKGPPAVLSIGLAAYGGISLAVAAASWNAAGAGKRRFVLVSLMIGAIVLPALAAILHRTANVPSLLCFALIGGGSGWLIASLCNTAAGCELWRVYSRTHPVGVLGAGLLAVWAWARMVGVRTGTSAALREFADEELSENLQVLVPGAALNNLEAVSFGVGIGSGLAIAACVWLIKDRPRVRAVWWIIIAWVVLNIAAFSVLGKGVQRYLTPAWPGVAMLGGLFYASLRRDLTWNHRRTAGFALGLLVAVLGSLQLWWYADGRERFDSERSPRAMVRELIDVHGVDPSRLVSVGFYTPAVDAYAGHLVMPVHRQREGSEPGAKLGVGLDERTMGVEPIGLDRLAELVRTGGPMAALVREREVAVVQERLAARGLEAEAIEMASEFEIDSGRSGVVVLRLGVANGADRRSDVAAE